MKILTAEQKGAPFLLEALCQFQGQALEGWAWCRHVLEQTAADLQGSISLNAGGTLASTA